MENKRIGNLLISISVMVGFVFLIFGISASIIAGKSILLTIQIILGLLMFLGIAILGSSIKKRKEKKYTRLPEIEIIKFDSALPARLETPIVKIEKTKMSNIEDDIKLIKKEKKEYLKSKKTTPKKGLNEEEKKIIGYLKKAEEKEMMQADLIKKVKITKVRMTRVLKKLEDKNLILKKRVGMNNTIVLK